MPERSDKAMKVTPFKEDRDDRLTGYMCQACNHPAFAWIMSPEAGVFRPVPVCRVHRDQAMRMLAVPVPAKP